MLASSPVYDLQRFGLGIVASPRHADVLLVTGTVTTRMREPLLRAYQAMPEPRRVAALGDCALGCDVLGLPSELVGPVEDVLPVDLRIPGCPPAPDEIAAALLRLIDGSTSAASPPARPAGSAAGRCRIAPTMTAPGLADVPLFSGLGEAALRSLTDEAETRVLLAGERLFAQGDHADDLYVVVRGRLRVTVTDEHGTRDVAELGPGAAVGELALLTGSPRSATVSAFRDTTLLVLPGTSFARVFEREPAVSTALARLLATQVQLRGGLPLPPSRPAVIAIRGLERGEPVDRARDVARRRRCARSARWRRSPAAPTTEVDRAEDEHTHVLLVDDGRRRRLGCALRTPGRPPAAGGRRAGQRDATARRRGADLVFLGPHRRPRSCDDCSRRRAPGRTTGWRRPLPDDPGVSRLARRLVGRALGLVLSGGGARGFAHIGVLEVLEEEGIVVDRYAGCSMGAFIAAMAAAGWGAGEIRDRCHEELVRRSPFNDYTLPRVALIRSRKAARMLDRLFAGLTIEELPKPLVTVSADLLGSTVVEHRAGA